MPGPSRNRPPLMVSRGVAGRNDRLEAALVLRSGHLRHTQEGDRQLEVALVENLCVCFLAARGFPPVQRVFVALERLGVVEGRRGHATTGRSVDEQAVAAESLQLLERGQESHLVEIDASVELVRVDLVPGGSDACALARSTL